MVIVIYLKFGAYHLVFLQDLMLKEAIVRTITFFDLFDYPLTSTEVWEYIGVKCGLREVIVILQQMVGKEIGQKDGFYFLKERDEIVEIRRQRYNYFKKKLARTKNICRIFRYIPGIKTIAISNVIGGYNLRYGGDLDFFIITEKDKIWLSRFMAVAITALLGLRPTPQKQMNKICLNFFLSENGPSIKKLKIENDIYFDYWIAGLIPVYDRDETFDSFINVNSRIKNIFPNRNFGYSSFRGQINKQPSRYTLKILNFIFGWFENILKKVQLKLLAPELKKIMNQDTRVVINDRVFKLHTHDRREEFREKYKRMINN